MQVNTYIYGKSFYYKFDTRAKILFSILISVALFFIKSEMALFLISITFILTSIISIGIKETLHAFKRLLPVLLFLFLLSPLQARTGEGLIYIKDFKLVTYEGILGVIRVALRFITISYVFVLLITTEKAERIILALEYFHLPYNTALMFSLILRYIPYLGSLYDDIKASMSLRLTEGKRGYPVMPVITALTVSAIKMIPETASSLEERGFGRKERCESRRLEKSRSLFTQILIGVILPLILIIVFA